MSPYPSIGIYHSVQGIRRLVPGLCFCLAFAAGPLAQTSDSQQDDDHVQTWIGPDGAFTFENYQEIETFLATAVITSAETLNTGITRPKKLGLELDGIRINAIFRDVEEFTPFRETPEIARINFRDSCQFECAAYRLARLLGLENVPPTVPRHLGQEDFAEAWIERLFESKKGTLQAWVEDAFTEKNRQELHLLPTDLLHWSHQFEAMFIFDSLIFNEDRNQTNILIGPDWKVWFVDATRAFRTFSKPKALARIKKCDSKLWSRLQQVTDDQIRRQLEPFLTGPELEAVVKRRQTIVEHIRGLIERKGEARVLF